MTNFRDYQTVKKLSEVAKENKPDQEVFPLAFNKFNRVMDGGVRSGELIVISGRTGHGKSLLCQQLTLGFNKVEVPSLWFSYEMNPWYLEQRFQKITPHTTDDLAIYSPTEMTSGAIEFIEGEIREAKERFACKIVFIDHLHYLVPLEQATNTSYLVGGMVRKLKRLAVKLDVIIFLIAHTKKIYEGESLGLHSIRDSSLVAQESDYVFLIERLKKDQKKLTSPSDAVYTNHTKVTLAKNRRTGKIRYVTFRYQDSKFVPITHTYDQ